MTGLLRRLRGRIPLTRLRLFAARSLYRSIRLFRKDDHARIVRSGIRYEVDLSEGIDLAVYVFGRFQRHVLDSRYVTIPPDGIAVDVGANMGSMTLPLAKMIPRGSVYAFEPTDTGYRRLTRNVALNPELAERITCVNAFLSDATNANPDIVAYSSWRVDRKAEGAHPIHGGSIGSADDVMSTTLDEFYAEHRLSRLDFIKIDTDGHEWHVLLGAARTIKTERPLVVFECGLSQLREEGTSLAEVHGFFNRLGYRLVESKSGREIDPENLESAVPDKSSIDALAIST